MNRFADGTDMLIHGQIFIEGDTNNYRAMLCMRGICYGPVSVRLSVCLSVSEMDMGWVHLWVGLGWVGLIEKYCGIVAEYCKTHTFHCR